MIRQCLSNKNESATVAKTQKFCKLNKALATAIGQELTERERGEGTLLSAMDGFWSS